jgi:hypothetical protein
MYYKGMPFTQAIKKPFKRIQNQCKKPLRSEPATFVLMSKQDQ